MPTSRHWGAVVRYRFQNGLPWGRLTVGDERCTIRSGLGRTYSVERAEVEHVELHRIRLPLSVRTVVRFRGYDGELIGPSFVPWCTKAVSRALTSAGWRTTETRLPPKRTSP